MNAGIDLGRIDSVSVLPLADEPASCLLTLTGRGDKAVIECRIDDLAKIAGACRKALRLYEEEQRMDEQARGAA